MEILPDHAPMIASLMWDEWCLRKVTVRRSTSLFPVVMLMFHQTPLMSWSMLLSYGGNIIVTEPNKLWREATERLTNMTQVGIDIARARYAQKRASARIEISATLQ